MSETTTLFDIATIVNSISIIGIVWLMLRDQKQRTGRHEQLTAFQSTLSAQSDEDPVKEEARLHLVELENRMGRVK